jgi:hypothetical protein
MTPKNLITEHTERIVMIVKPSNDLTYIITISMPVMATRSMDKLKNVKKRLLSSCTGSSACPLMMYKFKNYQTG